jgi:hypothetical protein
MTTRFRAVRILAAAGLTLGLLGLAPAANAERYSIDDPADAPGSTDDIHAFTYVHGPKTVRFVIQVDDLKASSTAGATVFFDTRGKRKGPEFALGTGLGSGTDYALFRAKGWRAGGDHPVACDYRIRLRYKTDRAVGSLDRKCLGEPARLRAAVKVGDVVQGDILIEDWAPGKRTFGLWVAAG